MNERYAIDPEAPADSRELKLLLDKFGLQKGRFIGQYPADWLRLLRQRLESAPPLERARVEDLLARRRSSFVPVDAPYQPTQTWASNASVAAQRHRAFDAIIGKADNGFGWPSAEQVLFEDAHALPSGVGAHVPMRAGNYVACVRPLLHASAEVFLIDPYFTLRTAGGDQDRRRWPVLIAFLRLAECLRTVEVLKLVLRTSRVMETHGSQHSLEDDLGVALEMADTRRVAVEYDLKDDVGHGRYLLSLHGGLQFDNGFEEHKTESNHIHWLSRPELEPLLARFSRNTRLATR